MNCNICPHNCNANRLIETGFCNSGLLPRIAKAQLHFWEEPPISGSRGSGAVFFSGCNLRCVYCQNHEISRGNSGNEVTTQQLAQIFCDLMQRGAHNINLVTPGHFIKPVAQSIALARNMGLCIPIVYNTNAYETVQNLRELEGLVDIYLPDIKYFDDAYAIKYSNASNYFITATKAILEMHRQVGNNIFKDGLLKSGMIIRHLVLPGLRKDSFKILDWIAKEIPDAFVSILAQYTPQEGCKFTEINRRITSFEYESVAEHFSGLGLMNGYFQDRSSSGCEYIPDF